jgi:hypothetical protein
MRDIPYDVWLCITQFIPRNELLRLYGVDCTLFDIVMNERYRETRIYHLGDEMTRQCLVGLGCAVHFNLCPLHVTDVLAAFQALQDASVPSTFDLISLESHSLFMGRRRA